jgi:hypothetical protein
LGSAYTFKSDPNCIIKGKIEFTFGKKKEIDRPINCAFHEKPELSFCEGDEVKTTGSPKMRVLTLVPKDEIAFMLNPNYGNKNREVTLDKIQEVQKYDCTSRLGALKKEIKSVVLNNDLNEEKPQTPAP